MGLFVDCRVGRRVSSASRSRALSPWPPHFQQLPYGHYDRVLGVAVEFGGLPSCLARVVLFSINKAASAQRQKDGESGAFVLQFAGDWSAAQLGGPCGSASFSLDAIQVLPASVAPERVSVVPGGSGSAMKHDDDKWKAATKHYKALLPALWSDKVRNVMDMSTIYGGFTASLVKDPVCVMNVVSSYGPYSLGIVYDRGLIGTNPHITSSPNCILLAVRCLAFPLLELN
ncbi:unnamed protein product [Triticum turgidum subsp. durum]|uniref:Methyltransferase n=1 Tax=Triticum turgidum subsp. durum TaxID=4567 RepID=A0A9R1Q8S3_TRITD|nr:unnamed protein product [Triticum turgidum subsp. durum]